MIILLLALVLQEPLPRDDGYRGIWYMNQPQKDEYRYKYSGGMATYPQQHLPIAIHVPAAKKTFFVYGGRPKEKNELLHMVSYFDHETGMVPRPAILLNKKTDDAHDNPVLSVDGEGHLWIFSNAHGTGRPAFIHRSVKPHSIDAFEKIATTNFSYGQPWHVPGKGFLFLHTRYSPGRNLFSISSEDGRTWTDPKPLARVEQGHYQVSWREGGRIGTAFDFHPKVGGLNARTNLHYLETRDFGKTWRTADGREAELPIREAANPALVRDYQSEKFIVYIKDLQFDAEGRPVILYLTSRGHAAGPSGDPRTWHTARWTGKEWEIRPFTTSDNNYDHGSIYIEGDLWRIIAPTDPGPQPYNPGGEMVMWTSGDRGASWKRARALTSGSALNHTFARRPVDAHPEFYAIWADGHGRQPSESGLYFSDREGTVRRLPSLMSAEAVRPEIVGGEGK